MEARFLASDLSRSPRGRIPVPESRMIRQSPATISTQEVFPPYLTVEWPGLGTEPRVPQQRTNKDRSVSNDPTPEEVRLEKKLDIAM